MVAKWLSILFILFLSCQFLIRITIAKKTDMSKYQKRTGKKFLNEISKKEGVIKLKSGMLIEVKG
jgi:hypothetical protein